MKLVFYIEQPKKRIIMFEEASLLDEYVKKTKLSPQAIIIMRNGSDVVGKITVRKYLQLENSIK